MTPVLIGPAELDRLEPLVAAFHAFEGIDSTAERRRATLAPLLARPDWGRVFVIRDAGQDVGYVALLYGYSIEFGGRDAFVDEIFLIEERRGLGLGRQVMQALPELLAADDIRAVHLEVAETNRRARAYYRAAGFEERPYRLMTRFL